MANWDDAKQTPAAPPIRNTVTGRPRVLTAVAVAWLLTAVALAVWSIIGWQHLPAFAAATERVFSSSAFADDDNAVALPEVSYAASVLVGSALALIAAIVAVGLLDGWRGGRVLAAVVGIAYLAFSVKVLLFNFMARIEPPDTGVPDRIWHEARTRFDRMTMWRAGAWYHGLSVAIGIVALVAVAASWYVSLPRHIWSKQN